MFNIMLFDLKYLYVKLQEKLNPILSKYRVMKLNNTDFTIISNNCWSGNVYRHFGLAYLTPTVGLYIFASDYIKFIQNLKYYTTNELIFVDTVCSKHFEYLKNKGQQNAIVGKLDDIEIIFLHYKSKDEALSKWKRRVQRINWDNLIIKFSEQNNCNDNLIEEFDKTIYKKKIVFVSKPMPNIRSAVFINKCKNSGADVDDNRYWNSYVNIEEFINYPID